MDIDKTLDKLEADLGGLLNKVPPVELREFATKRDFVLYAAEQIKLSKADTDPEVKKARLEHLFNNVQLAKNGFQDSSAKSLPVYSGPLSVQAQTAWKERSDKTTSPAAAAATTQPGPKGFAQKGDVALTGEQLLAAFAELLKEGEEEDDIKSTAAKSGEGEGDDANSGEGEGDADTSTEEDTGAAAEGEGEGDDGEGEGDGEGDDTKKSKTTKSKDPWGSSFDMNFKPSEDPDEFNVGSIRSF